MLPKWLTKPDPEIYYSDNYIVLDFETEVNDGRYGSAIDSRNHLALVCVYDNLSGKLSGKWGSEFDQSFLAERIKHVDFIVGHNLKYEYGWLRRIGVDIGAVLGFDTKLAEYVILGNLAAGDIEHGVRPVSTSLDDCCIRRGYPNKDPIVDLWMKHGISVSQMPRKWVEDRCKQDVETTHALFISQRHSLAATSRLSALYTRCLLTPFLASLEAEGMHLDQDRVGNSHTEYTERFRQLSAEFSAITGGINWKSPKQVAGYLYDTLGFHEITDRRGNPKRTDKGARRADKPTISSLVCTTHDQRSFVEMRHAIGKVGSALAKNLDYFKEICEHRHGTFHAEFNQTVTATHRLSSTGIPEVSAKSVQLQNIPRDFKCLFTARRDGWLIGEVDGSQLEFRVAAFLGNDSQAKRDIGDASWDAHLVTAAAMHKESYESVRERFKSGDKVVASWRQEAKSETFKPLYGGSKGTAAQERWYVEFKARYPELHAAQKGWVLEALHSKRLVTPWGLRYYFPNIRMSDSGFVNNGAAIFNYPIQALATAEIIPIACVYFWHRIRAQRLSDFIIPVSTVHDSLIAEIHPDYVEVFKEVAIQSFGVDVSNYLRSVYSMHFDVPLGVGIKVGTHWGAGTEESFNYLPDGKVERVK